MIKHIIYILKIWNLNLTWNKICEYFNIMQLKLVQLINCWSNNQNMTSSSHGAGSEVI